MIFVTVGTQLPFDRLVTAVDDWASAAGTKKVLAQVGHGAQAPQTIPWVNELTPAECRKAFEEADVIVAHAGIGSIITAIESGKPIVIMPRLAEHREHRNDHQVATCNRFKSMPNVHVAWSPEEVAEKIDFALSSPLPAPGEVKASQELLGVIAAFLEDSARRLRECDGIICFGGVDWWYHNRGHYDIQMMREFSKLLPVVYVNSIGMRTPKVGEGRIFAKRIARKLRSWARGLTLVDKNFAVLSPVSVPKFHQTNFARSMLAEHVKDAAAWMGIKNPLVWIAVPTAAEVLDRLDVSALVYQRTDRFEHFPGVNEERIRSYDLRLKQEADVTLFCSTSVFADEQAECRRAAFVDHGVDFNRFSEAGDRIDRIPDDVRSIRRPRIGFVGGIDAHTFDPELFIDVASAMPDCSFVMVGGCSLPDGWCKLPNVYLLGRRPFASVAEYMAACDVLIMPWNNSPWIKACNPVKLKEYLAVGRPVVTTPFDELTNYEGVVTVAKTSDDFIRGIREALEHPVNRSKLRRRAENETWSAKAAGVVDNLKAARITLLAKEHEPTTSVAGESAEAVSAIDTPATVIAQNVRNVIETPPRNKPRRYWRRRHLLAATLLAMIGAWVTADAWTDIFRQAMNDEEASHILLVLPAAAWLAWVRQESVRRSRRSNLLVGPMLVCLGGFLYAFGDTQLIQSFWYLGAILVVCGCALSVLGGDVLRRAWPAFAVLLFLIPVPGLVRQQISIPLQTVTAKATAFILETLGTPVVMSGNVLIVNDVSIGIAEACNGIRMVFALALVCYLYAFGTQFNNRTRFVILLASPMVAIGANVARLIPTVWLFGYSSVTVAETFHDVSGWAMMPIALGVLIGIRALVHWALDERQEINGALSAPVLSRT